MMDYNTTRIVHCEVCGKGFSDDCGENFCSSSCERKYEDEHAECMVCGDEVGESNLDDGICDNCLDEMEEEDNE